MAQAHYVIKSKVWWMEQGFQVSKIHYWHGDYWAGDVALAYPYASPKTAKNAMRRLLGPSSGGGTKKQDWTPRGDEFTRGRWKLEVVKVD